MNKLYIQDGGWNDRVAKISEAMLNLVMLTMGGLKGNSPSADPPWHMTD